MSTELAILVGCVLAAMIFVVFEILTPSVGLLTLLSVAAMAGAVYEGFQISGTVGIVTLIGLLVGMPVYVLLLLKYLPRTRLGRRLFLGPVVGTANTAAPSAAEWAELVGKVGLAETVLRPSGMIRIDGQRVPATAESGMIDKGTEVKVIRSVGVNVVVRPVRPESSERTSI